MTFRGVGTSGGGYVVLGVSGGGYVGILFINSVWRCLYCDGICDRRALAKYERKFYDGRAN